MTAAPPLLAQLEAALVRAQLELPDDEPLPITVAARIALAVLVPSSS